MAKPSEWRDYSQRLMNRCCSGTMRISKPLTMKVFKETSRKWWLYQHCQYLYQICLSTLASVFMKLSANSHECIRILKSNTVSISTNKCKTNYVFHTFSMCLNTNIESSDWINAKEWKCMPFISKVAVKNLNSTRGVMSRVLHVIRLCLYAGCLAVLYIWPFVLSVTSIYLNWSMLQRATVARPGPCCCSLM